MLVPHPVVLLSLRVLLILWIAFIAFASLARFNFTFDALTVEAWQIFLDANPFREHRGRASRAWDIGINLVLFMPIGFGLWLYNHWAPVSRLSLNRLTLIATAYGVALQALQLFLPRRVASLADAVWNAAGILLGIACAWLIWKTWRELRSSLPRSLSHNLSRRRSSR